MREIAVAVAAAADPDELKTVAINDRPRKCFELFFTIWHLSFF